MDEQPGCAEVRELLPELAAGVAVGEERGRALRHLGDCPECRRELEAMAMAVDELLTLAPPVQPPGGFESAVLAKVAASERPQRWRRWAWRLALAGVLGAAAGAGGVLVATADERRIGSLYRATLITANGKFLAARALTVAGGPRVGTVFAYEGTPSWVFVVVRDHVDAMYQVYLSTEDGRSTLLGLMPVIAGKSSWGTAIDVSVRDIAEVRLVGPAGPPLVGVFR
jgi:hypothetical protein